MSEQICAAHCAGQEFLHLRVLVFRSVHNHKEHVEVVMNVAPDEPRMGVEEHLEKPHLPRETGLYCYFAHPYCSCERGTNENYNGIIRRFLPKGTDFAFIKPKQVKEVQDWMNTYPRRILNGSTPLQSFKEAFGLMGLTIKLLEAC